jgi:hypothetical protein
MVKSYSDFVGESSIKRSGEITLSTLGGGLKEPLLSFKTQRNDDSTGKLVLELYTAGPKEYLYTPSENIQALMGEVNAKDKKVSSEKLEEVASLVRQAQTELSQDLLQLFTQLEEDIKGVLAKHNISEAAPSKESKK